MKDVEMISGARYERIDDRGLTVSFGEKGEGRRLLEVDNVVLCTGQEPLRELEAPLRQAGVRLHLIGGADVAAELDAKRAIDQGTRLAARLLAGAGRTCRDAVNPSLGAPRATSCRATALQVRPAPATRPTHCGRRDGKLC
jgi:hypothetical protein